MSYGVRKINPI